MQQDIKKMMSDFKEVDIALSKEHSTKFKALLLAELHQKKKPKKPLQWLSIAASIVLFIAIGSQFIVHQNIEQPIKKSKKEITLGTISPEFNTLETYYINSINLEISQLDLSEEHKELVDDYLLKIAELTKEYQLLTQELNTKGVNDDTIDALIRNLQLRLQLLKRLKKQIQQLKNLNTKQNEKHII